MRCGQWITRVDLICWHLDAMNKVLRLTEICVSSTAFYILGIALYYTLFFILYIILYIMHIFVQFIKTVYIIS